MIPSTKNIFEYLKEYAERKPNQRFFFDENRSYTVEETYTEVIAIANALHRFGVKQGDLIALRTTRSLDCALIMLATQALGAVALMCDGHARAENFIKDSGVEITPNYVITNENADMGISSNGNWQVIDWVKRTEVALKIGYPARHEKMEFEPISNVHAPAMVIFTSGSTGKSKGVTLSQYNYLNHILNYSKAGSYFADDVSMELLPLHHVFGLTVIWMGLVKGYCTFFPKNTEVEYIAECVEKHKITRLDGVPTFAYALATYVEQNSMDTASLRTGVLGGAPSTREQFNYIESTLGLTLVPVYGMSECIGISGTPYTDHVEARSSSVGKFLPMCQGYILNEEGEEVAQGQEGEICVICPAVMIGYYNDEAETKNAIDEKGRLHTGDLGYLDEQGYLHVSGRKKEIIIRNGHNISVGKIEQALLSIPEIYAAAVVGIKDKICDEVPMSLITLKNGAEISEEQVLECLRKKLAKNELPTKIKIVESLPMTSSGKVDKMKIKELFQGEENG